MKKFYSIVLMATMLLVGTNAWADYPANWLQAQFDTVHTENVYGTVTITMEDDITLDVPVYLGTATVDEPRKSIILDMNGHNITMSATDWNNAHSGVFCSMFNITHGELLVRNSDKSKTSLIQMLGMSVGNYNDIFNVAGSYKSSRWVKNGNSYEIDESAAINTRAANGGWFTHLEIGEGVKLFAANTVNGAGISIDGYYTNFHGQVSPDATTASVFGNTGLTGGASNLCLKNRADAPQYNTAILSKASEGVAYGVRVEVYGDIEFASESTTSGGKSYGIKLNGGLRSSLRSPEKFENQYCWAMDAAYAQTYGATAATPKEITIDSTSATAAYKKAYFDHRLDTVDAPFLYIGKNAHIIAAAEMNEATAIYASGYGKTLIEGLCSGNSGVNIKSGTVEMHDAEIICTATATSVYAAENGNKATGTGAVVVNSVDGRAGGIEVIISGDSKVSTDYGYAIAETVTANNDGTKVTAITIDGGTIQGGASTATNNGGAIIVSETTKNNDNAEVVVYGTNLTGNTNVQAGGTGTLDDLLPQTGAVITEVIVDGKPTIVVSEVEGTVVPVDVDPEDSELSIMNATGGVKWTGTVDQIINGNKTLDYLEMNLTTGTSPKIPVAQKLTIQAGDTLSVGRVVLGEAAEIIVEAGATFIITGEQGIIAPKVGNIVLKSNANKQAIFLFNPNVASNRHPKATVELTSKAYKKGDNNYAWQRFAVPTHSGFAVLRNDMEYDHDNYPTAIYKRVYSPDGWQVLAPANNEEYVPFLCYNMTTNVDHVGAVYTFKCELAGNDNVALPLLGEKWSYYGNSYTAPIDIAAMLTNLPSHVSKTVYVHNGTEDRWDAVAFADIEDDEMLQTQIMPMQSFVYRKQGAGDNSTLDYKYWVYNPAMGIVSSNPAPARRAKASVDYQRASIVMQAEDGTQEIAKLYLGSNFANTYDDGYDAEKLMNENGFNMYIAAEEGAMTRWATDNIENATINLQTKQATSYTMSFKNVTLEGYAVKDNLTGTVVEIANGNFYHFSTLANANVEGRFEIVPVAKIPTSIDAIEENAAVKGIYTLTGQYLGEDFNAIPAGVYIMNGKKVVK